MIPTNLKHKPIAAVEYQQRDTNASHGDAECLSIGFAQWINNTNDIACKIFRRTRSGQWSRQSEELPLWRALDLVIMIAALNKQLPNNLTQIQIDLDFIVDILDSGKAKAHIIPILQSKEVQDRLNELKKWL